MFWRLMNPGNSNCIRGRVWFVYIYISVSFGCHERIRKEVLQKRNPKPKKEKKRKGPTPNENRGCGSGEKGEGRWRGCGAVKVRNIYPWEVKEGGENKVRGGGGESCLLCSVFSRKEIYKERNSNNRDWDLGSWIIDLATT